MACACNKNKTRPFGPSSARESASAPTRYVLRTRLGQQSYASRLEAEAAQRRAGGGEIIEVRR